MFEALSPLAAALAVLLSSHAGGAAAQTSMIPYFGKNNVHYDKFEWSIYTTDHFEIYYDPAMQQHLERIAGYAESAYQQISADLKHDLSFKVPLIVFKNAKTGQYGSFSGSLQTDQLAAMIGV